MLDAHRDRIRAISKPGGFAAALFAVLFCSSAAWAQSQTFVFEQGMDGYEVFEDTTIFSESDNSDGGTNGIFPGTINLPFVGVPRSRRAFLRLDLSSIPAGSAVQSVSLQMTVSLSGGNFGDIDYALHRVAEPWNEGSAVGQSAGGFGGTAKPGDATWDDSELGVARWDSPGGDFAANASAVTTAGLPGQTAGWSDGGMVADVQGWIDAPETNFGWIVISAIEGERQRVKKFHSSEATASRPVFTVMVDTAPGEGEGEEPLCDVLAESAAEWEDFSADFFVVDDDMDMDGLPEEAPFLLLEAVCATEPRGGLASAVSYAYEINLAELDLEADAAAVDPYRKALAALFSTSVQIQLALVQLLEDNGIALAGMYEVVTEADGAFLPAPTELPDGNAGFLVALILHKAIDEPFSGAGDLDGDGESNAEEFERVVTQGGGSVADFAAAAADSDDTVDPPGGGGCVTTPSGSRTPNPMDAASVLAIILVLVFLGRRERGL